MEYTNRKRLKYKTEPRTYAFFSDDVDTLRKNGWSPKELLRLGILSRKNNPQMIKRINEVEEDNKTLQNRYSSSMTKLRELQAELAE
ncbi:hypothetical protein GOV10_01060, partial [Candidatus Woesearchaeota archaeon]|nr:hypothetical protein [Candidatus Woesearchaeota archaeon]